MDDFSKQLDNQVKTTLLLGSPPRGPNCGLTHIEIATILVMAHYVRFRVLRFAILSLILFISARRGNKNDIYYIDSSCLPVFFNKHQLDHGMGIGRFDPDLKIAEAWERLNIENHTQTDIMLFQHEHFESRFERIFKTTPAMGF